MGCRTSATPLTPTTAAWAARCWPGARKAGENSTEEGIVSTLADGKAGTTRNVAGTEYLYGVGCTQGASCILAGASQVGATGYSHGVLAQDTNGTVSNLRDLPNTNGLGQVACAATLDTCTTIGSAINP